MARVRVGPAQRRGIAELDGEGEVVGGIVVMRYGENALDVIDAVKARLAEVAPTLPAGVEVVPTYDRSQLIRASDRTRCARTLIEEMIVVSAGHRLLPPARPQRAGAGPDAADRGAAGLHPDGGEGLTANIMSLGGIAVAIGAMVDASIIMVENVHKRLEGWEAERAARPARPRSSSARCRRWAGRSSSRCW